MKRILLVALLVSVALAVELINDQDRIAYINKHATWEAKPYEMFNGVAVKDAHHFLGLLKRPREYLAMPVIDYKVANDLPVAFDPEEQWPGRITPIRDQASCGSCWAFGAAEALSDVFNIANPNDPVVILSPQHLVSCDKSSFGCQGGYPDRTWNYLASNGITTDACYPYTSGGGVTGTCKFQTTKPGEACPSGFGTSVYYYATKQGRIAAKQEAIMTHMMTYGPIEMGFHVYSDFMSYRSGVYYHVSGGLQGGHAIKCTGWGVDSKTNLPYWICANSWGTSWGMQGYFWIKRGTDECGIESWFTVGGQAGNIVE